MGLGMGTAGFIACDVFVKGFDQDLTEYVPGLFLVLGLCGFLFSLATWRMVEFAGFESDAGVVVLAIAKKGPDQERFDEFVNLLLEQIKQARGMS